MTVNSTSSTATTPMTSLARRDSVGTGTGGRMATVGLLSFLRPTRWRARRPVPHRIRPWGARTPPETEGPDHGPLPQLFPMAAGSPTGSQAHHAFQTVRSAGGRGLPVAEVGERGEGVVQGGDLGHRQAQLG